MLPCGRDEVFNVGLALPVDASFMLMLDGKEGESGVVALAFGLVSSSSDESPPARASNSASRSAILTLVGS